MAQYSYALIDGVMRQTAIKDIYKSKEPIQVIPLYMGTRFQDNYDLGPILVASLNGSLIYKLQENDWPTSTTILTSDKTLTTVAEHLKQFIEVTNDTGSNSLFRFADPLTTSYWLSSYPENALVDIMGPINTWQVATPSSAWSKQPTKWQLFTNPKTEPMKFRLDYLNEPQMEALNQVASFRFKNKIYQWLALENPQILADKTSEQIDQWIDISLAQAEAFNLTTERTIAIWVDLCADYGQDFINSKDSLYQQWLTENTQYKALPADIKIEKFYEYAAIA